MDAREEMLEGLKVIKIPSWNADLVSNKENLECLMKFIRIWVERWPELRVDDYSLVINVYVVRIL